MGDAVLHLVKVPLRAEKLVRVSRRRGIPLRDLDDGYLAHCVLREVWQERAPAPFVLRGRGRCIDAWGYSRADACSLIDHARHFADPALLSVIDDVDGISSRPMPTFEKGRRVGFHLRACPVVRLSSGRRGHRAGAEIDAFLARCLQVGPSVVVSREDVYRQWLAERLRDATQSGVTAERISIAAFSREHLTRRTGGETREARRLERPDVRFEGDLVVDDGARFLARIEKGIGRHRAFGFGAIVVVPAGSPYPHT